MGDTETRVPLDGSKFEFVGRTGEYVCLVATRDAERVYVHEERGDGDARQAMDHVFSCTGDEARRTTTSKRGTSFDAVFKRV